jgi:ABC-type transport system involved in multi-copper enzyme maturation permease subunit
MSSKGITEKIDSTPAAPRWHVAREVAPSVMKDDLPVLPRIIGAAGLLLVVLGGVPLASRLGSSTRVFKVLSDVMPAGLAAFLAVLGVGCLLYHAAMDGEFQIRRAYMWKGLAWLLLGVILSIAPAKVGDDQWVFGTRFVPFGILGLVLGLLFEMAFIRNETELTVRDRITYVIGGLGAVMAVGGLFFGTIFRDFLLTYGWVLILWGFFFLWAFIGLRGVADQVGRIASFGVGIAGAVAFAIAFVRSAVLPWLTGHQVDPYAIPYGLVMMTLSGLYGVLGLALLSDNGLVVLTRRELASLFFSPIAYTVMFGFVAIGGLLFWKFTTSVLLDITPQGAFFATVQEPIVAGYFEDVFLVICAIFVVPVTTMRLLSEEKRTGTMEMLMTVPINETVVVLSKFLAAFIFFMVVWLPWALYLVALRWLGGQPFDYLPILAFYIALAASGAGFVAMGVFCSSLTKNQIAAAILCFMGMLILTLFVMLPRFARFYPNLAALGEHLSYYHLWANAVSGNLTLRDLLFHLSAAVFWLFLTVKVLEARKWW